VTSLARVLVLLVGLAGLGTGVPLVAQTTLAASETGYQSALNDYNAILAQLQRTFNLQEQAAEELELARRTRDEPREGRALASFRTRALEVMQLERDAEAAVIRLREAARAFLAALDAREIELLALLDAAPPAMQRAQLSDEVVSVRRRILGAQPHAILVGTMAMQPVPELVIDPRDGPSELRNLASFLEGRAGTYQSIAEELDREILAIERRIQRERGLGDLLTGVGRFDDFLPGTAPAGAGGGGMARGAETVHSLAQLSLPDQVLLLRGIRDQALLSRSQVLAQAQVLRARAEGRLP